MFHSLRLYVTRDLSVVTILPGCNIFAFGSSYQADLRIAPV